MSISDMVSAALQNCLTQKSSNPIIQFDDVYKDTLSWHFIPAPGKETITVYAKTLTGRTLAVQVYPDSTVEELKAILGNLQDFPRTDIRLIFSGRQLENGRKISEYSIRDKSTVHFVLVLRGGGDLGGVSFPKLDPGFLDAQYDYDFTWAVDAAEYKRGGVQYMRPNGWKRYAIKLDKYGQNLAWIGGVQRVDRQGEVEGEWAVSYHGTMKSAAENIVITGYDASKSKRQLYGQGIYSTPDPRVAEDYASVFEFGGKRYKFIIQNRVNLEQSGQVTGNYSCDGINKSGPYYVTPREEFIRPYGICIKQI